MTLVLDASAMVDVLVEDELGDKVQRRIRAESPAQLYAPELINIEIASSLARMERHGDLTRIEAEIAFANWCIFAFTPIPLAGLEQRAWALRKAVRVADAFYIAAAEMLAAPILTCDGRLARSGVTTVQFIHVHTST